MKDKIVLKIKEIEEKENIKILFACESGSRAWGFASPDSDYDIRFIYIRPIEWYLSVFEGRDVLEFPLDENDFDISGWDLKKSLQLLYKSNPPLLEWMQSPIVYFEAADFAARLLELGKEYFSAKSAAYHYLSIARRNFVEYFKSDKVKLKKYFYVLRSLFAAKYVVETGTIPPMEFQRLLDLQLNTRLIEKVNLLLSQKIITPELGLGPRIHEIDEYIESEIKNIEELLVNTESSKEKDLNKLNIFFDALINKES